MNIPFLPAKNFRTASRKQVSLIVIHTMEYPEKNIAAEWCGGFFAGSASPMASAHYAVDNDSIVQCVRDKDIAWHTPGALGGRFVNDFSIGIEHAGYASQSPEEWGDAFSVAMLERSAELVARLCRQYDIPIKRLSSDELRAGNVNGITGHVDCTHATGSGTHTDPGPNFPWEWYLERVQTFAVTLPMREPIVIPPEVVTPPDFSMFVPVELDGVTWLVSPIYIAPVGIGQARDLAASLGGELPSPALVDAIYRAADLKIRPLTQATDGTPATMDSAATHAKVASELAIEIGLRSLGTDYRLLAGAFKDVVQKAGVLGLYGYHVAGVDIARLAGQGVELHACETPGPERVIQSFFSGHAASWRDYSQGFRLVKRG